MILPHTRPYSRARLNSCYDNEVNGWWIPFLEKAKIAVAELKAKFKSMVDSLQKRLNALLKR
jgi:hypothetical protein